MKDGTQPFFIFSYYNNSLPYLLENQKDPGFELCWVKQKLWDFRQEGEGRTEEQQLVGLGSITRWTCFRSDDASEPPKAALGFPNGSDNKVFVCNAGDWGSIPESGRSPGEGNGYHSSILYLENSWREKPAGVQSLGLQRVGHNWVTNIHTHKGSPQPIRPAFWTLTAIR